MEAILSKEMKILGICRSDSVPRDRESMSQIQEETLLTTMEWNPILNTSGKSKDRNYGMHFP